MTDQQRRAAQDAAIRRANPALQPDPYPGGLAARARAEWAAAKELQERPDAWSNHRIADRIAGHEAAAIAYENAAAHSA